MHLLIHFLPLVAVLQVSLAQRETSFVIKLSKQQQEEIVDMYNAARRSVEPTASNMQKMKWSDKAAEGAEKWAAECQAKSSLLDDRYADGPWLYPVESWDLWFDEKQQVGSMAENLEISSFQLEIPKFHRMLPCGNVVDALPKPYKEGPSCADCPDACDDKLCTNPCKYINHLSAKECANIIDHYECEVDWVQEKCKASCNCETR
nr:cysteine-rich venom protein pseudechetoxin-like [Anolis sagrei ordinatus]